MHENHKKKAERMGGGVGEVDAVDPHSPTLFLIEDVPVPLLPPSLSTPFVLSFSLIPLSLVYWLHSEFLHKSAFISALLIV